MLPHQLCICRAFSKPVAKAKLILIFTASPQALWKMWLRLEGWQGQGREGGISSSWNSKVQRGREGNAMGNSDHHQIHWVWRDMVTCLWKSRYKAPKHEFRSQNTTKHLRREQCHSDILKRLGLEDLVRQEDIEGWEGIGTESTSSERESREGLHGGVSGQTRKWNISMVDMARGGLTKLTTSRWGQCLHPWLHKNCWGEEVPGSEPEILEKETTRQRSQWISWDKLSSKVHQETQAGLMIFLLGPKAGHGSIDIRLSVQGTSEWSLGGL